MLYNLWLSMINLKKGVNWSPTIFLIIFQVALIIWLPFYFYYNRPTLSMVAASVVLLYATGLSITGGYHRFYSHRSYKTNLFLEWLLLFFGSMAGQGSALRWSYDHRLHHAFVDTDKDPYSIQKGFWYAHFLWIIEKPRPINPKVVSDLISNPLVVFQHRFYVFLFILTNSLVFLSLGWFLNDYIGALTFAVGVRLFCLYHSTWFINSLAHTWGDQPFSQEHSAVNNYIISFLTFGEGYHNYHHTYANDYRNGIYWYQFDPTKWLIWLLSKLGLAYHLRTTDKYTIKKRMVTEHAYLLQEKLVKSWESKRIEWEPIINELASSLVRKMTDFSQLKSRYRELKTQCTEAPLLKEIKKEMKALQKSLRQDWKKWWQLSKTIMSHA
ncbi:putative acyl-CoA desaturase [Neochlamydia sp. EPS4]|nr:putative acyl-CoA desaturase [Neochlamydia sp. EPS4]